MELVNRLQAVVKASPHQRERLAAALSVSASTIDRWAVGAVQPTARHVAALEDVLTAFQGPAKQEVLLRALSRSLSQAREVMHKYGAASSRNDALDQISLLLTVHLHLKRTGRQGIQTSSGDELAALINNSVHELRTSMPPLAHDRLISSAQVLSRKHQYLQEITDAIRLALNEIDESGDWSRPHDFHELFVTFIASSFHEEKEFAQYMTPREVVDFMVRVGLSLIDIKDRHPVVLDPSCGTASFLMSFAEIYAEKLELTTSAEFSRSWVERDAGDHLIGIDTSERMIRLAAASFVAADIEPRRLFLDSSLSPESADTRMALEEGSIDLILTNPPFGAEHSRGQHGGGRVPSEILYVEQYAQWLRPGGIALSIVPDSVLTNKGAFADLRERLTKLVDLVAVVSLPPVTFAASGTTTKTSIIVFRKKLGAREQGTVFAVAGNVGFDVSTRGSIRKRVPNFKNDLPEIGDAIIFGSTFDAAATHFVGIELARWDAQYATSPLAATKPLGTNAAQRVPLGEVANLVKEKADPRSEPGGVFNYIEISTVDGELLRVSSTLTRIEDAPSRARRRVRAGDILVSTVRPDNRTIGVVPPHLDGAICSTGFAVLRTNRAPPYAVAAALRSPEVTAQLIGVSSGVAYPAFDPNSLPSITVSLNDKDWQAKCIEYGKALEALEVHREAVLAI